jgi:hypothetical protein
MALKAFAFALASKFTRQKDPFNPFLGAAALEPRLSWIPSVNHSLKLVQKRVNRQLKEAQPRAGGSPLASGPAELQNGDLQKAAELDPGMAYGSKVRSR